MQKATIQLGTQTVGVGRVLKDVATGEEYVVRQIHERQARVVPRDGYGGGWIGADSMGCFRITDERELRIDSPTLERLPPSYDD